MNSSTVRIQQNSSIVRSILTSSHPSFAKSQPNSAEHEANFAISEPSSAKNELNFAKNESNSAKSQPDFAIFHFNSGRNHSILAECNLFF